jgi:phenylacetaldehyde dehydrogenase
MNTPTIRPLMNYISGQFLAPDKTLAATVHDPNTGDLIQAQKATSEAEVTRALDAAAACHDSGMWANTSLEERALWLDQVADYLMARVNDIATVESYNTGIVISLSGMVNHICHLAFRAAANELRSGWLNGTMPGPYGDVEILHKPLGVAVCIAPWNSPAALGAHKIANALAAGCPTILKPSEWAPYSSQFLADAIDAVGMPHNGLFQLVNGGARVGSQLVEDNRVRAVSFTGGLHGGRAVAAACARDFKSLQLELGGNNALVVMPDADIEQTAIGIVEGMTTLNGQWCRALGRLIVPEALKDAILEAAISKLAQVKIGHSLNPVSQMGPLVHGGQRDAVAGSVMRLGVEGGVAHYSTPLPTDAELAHGYWFAPTLISGVAPEMTLEEVFGPVATVHTYATEQEAVALANQTPYGLGGYVFGRNEANALAVARQMQTGGVKVNGVSLMELNVDAPRPAWGLSGFGVEGTRETMQVFLGQSVVGVAAR